VGIIGRNGAGKTTLLKILFRITHPTSGRVELRGRVSSLLEVGTGFHQELTGRENIYLNGTILGMSKAEVDRKFDEIVAFSGVEKFIDTPVKRYSSGMKVRLAFAVAAHLEPEILLIDEVLAVGDVEFQRKCLGKMQAVAGQGRTVLFVSHNMGSVNKLCKKSIWLDTGTIRHFGSSSNIIEEYVRSAYESGASVRFARLAGKQAQILGARLLNESGQVTSEFLISERPILEIDFVLNQNLRGLHVACIVSTSDGTHVFSTADTDTKSGLLGLRKAGNYTAQVCLPTGLLNVGTYHIAVGLGIPGISSFDRREALTFTLHDSGDFGTMKEGRRRAGLLLVKAEWEYI
jgi:ABC-type polysaccharide/polyol phosphate transport system ATPase subunit